MRLNPRILAHRGASGHQPENTLAAFREAARLGADGVELDIHATKDGALVVQHDFEVPGLGLIAELTLESIRSAGSPAEARIPTLGEALEVLSGMEVWIEVKALPAALDRSLLVAIDQAPSPERCAVHSFDHRIIARLGARNPQLRLGVLSTSYPLDPVGQLGAAGAGTLWQEWRLIDEEVVAAVHRAGAEIIAWTVNDAARARRLAELGVDALCGNFPERLRLG